MKKRKNLFYLCASALCAALITVCSYVAIPVGSVKFSLQLFAVLVTAGLLPPLWALGTVAAYILLGVCGVPVFAAFGAGVGIISGPTGGYILGFLPMVLAASLGLKLHGKRTLPATVVFFLLSLIPCYLCGILGTYIYMPDKGMAFVLSATFLPYVPFDLIKLTVAALLVWRLYPRFNRFAQGEG